MTLPLYTVGHSSRSLDELVALLEEHEIAVLVDVRRFPWSRRHPHFDREALTQSLPRHGVEYRHEEALGGRRDPPSPDSPNSALTDVSFRAYADHTGTGAFRDALGRVLETAEEARVALMCAEAGPWHCHRRIISDVVLARGRPVVHIMGPGETREHEMHPDARVSGDGTVTWPAPRPPQTGLFDDV